MKLILALFVFCLLSCKSGLSDQDKKNLLFYIDLHNSSLKTKFSVDSINETTKVKIRYITLHDTATVNNYLRAHMAVFANEWNSPYNIQKDRFLTLQSYLDYCKAHNYEPTEYIKFID